MRPHDDDPASCAQVDRDNIITQLPRSDCRHDSKVSLQTNDTNQSIKAKTHEEYIDSLIPPTQQKMDEIAEIQDHKEAEIIQKNAVKGNPNLSDGDRDKAAALIQRNYRGYRERRQINGMGLDPSSRWVEAIKEARYRDYTAPKARVSLDGTKHIGSEDVPDESEGPKSQKELAKKQWRKVGYIARRAVADEDSSGESSNDEENISEDQRAERRKQKEEKRRERQKTAKIMDLQLAHSSPKRIKKTQCRLGLMHKQILA